MFLGLTENGYRDCLDAIGSIGGEETNVQYVMLELACS